MSIFYCTMRYLLSVLIAFFTGNLVWSQMFSDLSLDNNWYFHKENDQNIYPASVPGNIFTDLFDNKIIGDPFYGCNADNLRWVENETWIYENTFDIDNKFLGNDHIEMIFEGLDTYAEIILNGHSVLKADNMFRKWKVSIKDLLLPGKNSLIVKFRSSVNNGRELSKKLSYKLPEGERVFVRKGQYQFGWDWGPRMVGCGIWKKAYLRGWNNILIENVQLIQNSLDDDNARMTLKALINSDISDNIEIEVTDIDSDKKYGNIVYRVEPGIKELNFRFNIEKPVFWWTHDKGKPHMYNLRIVFKRDGENILDLRKKTGLRNIMLVNQKDSIGESFYFILNNKAVYIKGANYIPQDVFPARVQEKTYRSLLEKAKWSNYNMLRVWGGGIYENDIFYELCDSLGIMVWQDFMFACAMYPGDEEFLKNVKSEITEQVIRLREHASLALWCGNNEIDEGWHNWGWQKQFSYSDEDSIRIYSDYKKLFHELIPEVLNKEDNSRYYWPSSPKYGWGRAKSLTHGDSHYWGVWWGMEPFSVYKQKVPRFSSEYGFQGFPELSTLKKAIHPDSLYPGSVELKCHQKHPRGFETIDEYMKREWPFPKKLQDYIYMSQLVQAYGIRTALEAHRSAMPYNMGTLYWQFNDCWPVVSWASLDYYHRPKALQFFARKAFAPIVLISEIMDNKLKSMLINDTEKDFKFKMTINIYNQKGDRVFSYSARDEIRGQKKELDPGIETSRKIEKLISEKKHFYVALRIEPENMPVVTSSCSSALPKEFRLANPEIRFAITEVKDGILLFLRSSKFAKDVKINISDDDHTDFEISENYFDMEPGIKYPVFIKISGGKKLIRNKIQLSSFYDYQ